MAEETCAKAAKLEDEGKGVEAVALLREALQAPDLSATSLALLHSDLGNALLLQGRQAEAEEHLAAALQLRSSAAGQEAGGEDAEKDVEDNWENEWEDSLAQLKLDDTSPKKAPAPQKKPAPREPSRTDSRGTSHPTKPADTGAASSAAVSSGPKDHSNVIEIYNINASVPIADLEAFVEDFQEPGSSCRPLLVVVDDYHALGVFATPVQARQAMSMALQAGLQARPHAEASAVSKQVSESQLQPPKARPKTTSAVARRLLGSALGMNLRDKAADKELADQRRAKREASKAKKQAQSEVWDD